MCINLGSTLGGLGFVFLGQTIQSRFSHVSILVPKSFICCEGDVEIDTKPDVDLDHDGLIDFMEIVEKDMK